MNAVSARLAASTTLIDGGGTFDRTLCQVTPKRGYAVGLVEGTWRRCDRWVGDVAAAIEACLDACPYAPYVGTWVEDDGDTSLVHVDPIIILSCPTDAMVLGYALGQKSIWNFAAGHGIDLL